MGGKVGYKEAERELKLAGIWVTNKYIEKVLHLQTLNKREKERRRT
jgi:hypothetical protein